VETIGMGGGSAQVNPPYQVSVAEGLTDLLGERVTVVDGVEVRRRAVAASATHLRNPETGGPGTRVVLYGADGAALDERDSATALTTITLEEVFADHVTRLRIRTAVVLAGPVEIGVIGAGEWTVTHGGGSFAVSLPAQRDSLARELIAPPAGARVVDLPRQDTERGVVEAVVDLAHPAGTRRSDLTGGGGGTPALTGMGTFGLTVRPAPRPAADVIADAARAAATADVAVVVVGVTEEQETETVDKTTLRLPGDQDELVRAVAAAARRTVVVVNAATPVVMPWLDDVDAVLWAGLPGQEAGRAIAAALLGDIEPAGRLVTTFPAGDGAAPAWSVTPVDGDLEYREGTFVGYRGHHAGRAPAPAFWLGHGLGYATWEYGAPELVEPAGPAGTDPAAGPTVAVTVTNTGSRRSREVVQVYLRPAEEDQPVRLAGWRAVTVGPGESARVAVACDSRMWRRWDTGAGSWARLAGGSLLVARGLGDVRATIGLPE
jgi:beta-glucosidase